MDLRIHSRDQDQESEIDVVTVNSSPWEEFMGKFKDYHQVIYFKLHDMLGEVLNLKIYLLVIVT